MSSSSPTGSDVQQNNIQKHGFEDNILVMYSENVIGSRSSVLERDGFSAEYTFLASRYAVFSTRL